MAEKAEKKPEAAPPPPPADDKKSAHGAPKAALMTKTPVLLGGVMVLEAAVLFAGFKFLGGGAPHASAGAEIVDVEHGHGDGHGEHGGASAGASDKKRPVEILVLEFRAPNKISGRTFVYDVSVYVQTRNEHQEKVKQIIKDREALIKDRIRTIIAQSEPEKLGGGSLEPGLETFRRQVKYQLDEIVGEGLIDEVLVPRCIPFRADY